MTTEIEARPVTAARPLEQVEPNASLAEPAEPTRAHWQLLEQVRARKGYARMTRVQQQRADRLVLAADAPALWIFAADNEAKRDELGFTLGQWKKLNRAMKDAHLLAVQRRWKTLPNGTHVGEEPASWSYALTDAPLPSQIPKPRKKKTDVRLGRLEAENRLQADRIDRLETAIKRMVSIGQEHVF